MPSFESYHPSSRSASPFAAGHRPQQPSVDSSTALITPSPPITDASASSASASSSSAEPLPPTINNLDPHHRSQLVKSSLKLKGILGATPQVLETPPTPPALPPSPVTASPPKKKLTRRSTSTLNLSLARRPTSAAHPSPTTPTSPMSRSRSMGSPLPVLRIPARRPSLSLAHSPSLASPDSALPSPRTLSRARLAKLRRQLGDEFPAALVIPTRVSESDLPSPRKRVRRSHDEENRDWPEAMDWDRLCNSEDGVPPLNEKQKAMYVRRALKMAQVFGALPPHTLVHSTHPMEPESMDFEFDKRDSIANILSMAAVPLPDSEPVSEDEDDFTVRRKRAVKLARFFGAPLPNQQSIVPEVLLVDEHKAKPAKAKAKQHTRATSNCITLNATPSWADCAPQDVEAVLNRLRELK